MSCEPNPAPQTLNVLNKKLVFCFLVKIQRRLDTILGVGTILRRTKVAEGLYAPSLKLCPEPPASPGLRPRGCVQLLLQTFVVWLKC